MVAFWPTFDSESMPAATDGEYGVRQQECHPSDTPSY